MMPGNMIYIGDFNCVGKSSCEIDEHLSDIIDLYNLKYTNELWEKTKRTILETAEKHIPKKKKGKTTPWLSKDANQYSR